MVERTQGGKAPRHGDHRANRRAGDGPWVSRAPVLGGKIGQPLFPVQESGRCTTPAMAEVTTLWIASLPRRGCVPVGEQKVGGTDQHRSQRVGVWTVGDTPKFSLRF